MTTSHAANSLPSVTYSAADNMLCITPPPLKQRTRINLVAVVDCSGSMSTAVSTSTEVTHGFTTLNLVNHGVQTLISSLDPEIDQFGLVSFDSSAIVEFPLALLNSPSSRARAKVVTDALKPRGTTKIWLGLLAALEMLMDYEKKAVAAKMVVRGWPIIILQTDGVDDDGANANFAANLLAWRQQNPMLQQPLIFTTGFGINSESEKLAALADAGDGLYAYIHNAGSVGTVFVNALANMFSLLGTRLILHVTGQPPISLALAGPILFGQTKYIKVASIPLEALSLSYEGMDGERITIKAVAQKGSISSRELFRQDVVTTFKQALWQLTKKVDTVNANMVLKGLADRLDLAGASVNPELEALLDDTAEARNAVLQVLNGSWGGPHLRSIIAAHEKQVCLDFKNPGLQFYSSPSRNTIVTSVNAVFNSLPPPTASLQAQSSAYSAPASMAAYNQADDPCVHGKSVTVLADASTVRADQLKKGDVLQSNGATIICVVKTLTSDGYASLVQVPKSNLCITPFHPIRFRAPNDDEQQCVVPGCGEWLFPQETASPAYLPCIALYSFILSSGHTIFFDGIETVTLGHGFTDNHVVQHPYLGSKMKVVADLARMPGYADQGLLTFQSGCLKRDPVIGIVNGFDEAKLL